MCCFIDFLLHRRITCFFFFFFNDTATTEIYTLSLHDALPILGTPMAMPINASARLSRRTCKRTSDGSAPDRKSTRLNSSHSQISYAVFCLKKKKKKIDAGTNTNTINIWYPQVARMDCRVHMCI